MRAFRSTFLLLLLLVLAVAAASAQPDNSAAAAKKKPVVSSSSSSSSSSTGGLRSSSSSSSGVRFSSSSSSTSSPKISSSSSSSSPSPSSSGGFRSSSSSSTGFSTGSSTGTRTGTFFSSSPSSSTGLFMSSTGSTGSSTGSSGGTPTGILSSSGTIYTTGPGSSSTSGPAAIITTNSSCPFSTLADPDILLDVPHLTINHVSLGLKGLSAKVAVKASLGGGLLDLEVGVQAKVDEVNFEVDGVDAQLRLEGRFAEVAAMINRTLSSLDANPVLLQQLAVTAQAAVANQTPGLLAKFSTSAATLIHLLDPFGQIVQRLSPLGSSAVTNQTIIGTYKTLLVPVDDVPVPQPSGNMVQRFRYDPFGTLAEITFFDKNVVATRILLPSISESTDGAFGG